VKGVSPGTARRYARALLDLALEQGVAERVRGELAGARELLARQTELAAVLSHPALPADRRRAIVAAVWGPAGVSPLVERLLTLLAERGRIGLLPGIETVYSQLWNLSRGVVAAHAVSAVALDAVQQQALEAAIRTLAGREVELTTALEPQLLGGVRVTLEGRVFDGSVRARLAALRQRLSGARMS
jgi:F-type H+-transporting ATPase subunit delta